jgi:hypothetical protein
MPPKKRDNYEIDPDTGLPRRIMADERKKREEAEDRERKLAEAAAKRRQKRVGGDTKKPSRAKKPKTSIVNDEETGQNVSVYHERLPHGGTITLQNPEEVAYFRGLKKEYEAEYASLLLKPNDRNRLSQLINFELIAHRYTQRMMGTVNVYDGNGNITGIEKVDPVEMNLITQNLPKVQDEIRKLEGALKIDKRTREGSGEGDIRNYMETLKKAAINYKVHLSKRYEAYDEFVNETRWRLRVIRDADNEDRAYHGLDTPEKFFDWMNEQLRELEEIDKEFAVNKQALWLGKV